MSTAVPLILALAAVPEIADFWPCVPGMTLEYKVLEGETDTEIRITDTVRAQQRKGTCVIDRKTERPDSKTVPDAYVLEHLADRILFAGAEGYLTAFRPPVLKSPLQVGATWAFNGVRYRVTGLLKTVRTPAGVFKGCVRVEEVSLKGAEHRGSVTYAPGIGPILKLNKDVKTVLELVKRPPRLRKKPL